AVHEREPVGDAVGAGPAGVLVEGTAQPENQARLSVAVAEERGRVVAVAVGQPVPLTTLEMTALVVADRIRDVVQDVIFPHGRDEHVRPVDLEELRAFPQRVRPHRLTALLRTLASEPIVTPREPSPQG